MESDKILSWGRTGMFWQCPEESLIKKEMPNPEIIFWDQVWFPVSRQYGVSLKTKIELLIWSSNPTLGQYLEESISLKDICTSLFTAALFTAGKIWKKPKCPSTDDSSAIKRMKYCMWSNMDGSREYHIKWSEPGRERQILHVCGI